MIGQSLSAEQFAVTAMANMSEMSHSSTYDQDLVASRPKQQSESPRLKTGIFAMQQLVSSWPVLVAAFAPTEQVALDALHAQQLFEVRKSNHSNQQQKT